MGADFEESTQRSMANDPPSSLDASQNASRDMVGDSMTNDDFRRLLMAATPARSHEEGEDKHNLREKRPVKDVEKKRQKRAKHNLKDPPPPRDDQIGEEKDGLEEGSNVTWMASSKYRDRAKERRENATKDDSILTNVLDGYPVLPYVIDLDDTFSDIPTTLLRGKDDVQDNNSEKLGTNMSTNDFVLQKLIEVLSNSRNGGRDMSKRSKKVNDYAANKRQTSVIDPKLSEARRALQSESIYRADELISLDQEITSDRQSKVSKYSQQLFPISDEISTSLVANSLPRQHSVHNRRQFATPTTLKEYEIPKSVMYATSDEVNPITALSKGRIGKIDISSGTNPTDSYAECYPGTAAEEDVNIDSDDEPDYDKMDFGNRKGPVGRWDFETQEEYSNYMSSREAVPKAAFQYGVKMADGRKTRTRQALMNDKRKLDKQWQQITKIIEKRKGGANQHTE